MASKIIASTLPAFAPPIRGEYNVVMQIDPQARALFPRIYDVVRQVPRGKVTTYGDVAQLIGPGCDARLVGYAMAECPDDVPWQRVINAQGKISLRSGDGPAKQQMRLEAEGVDFDARGKIDLNRFRWAGPGGEFAPSQPSLFE
jgi:methylated-DNA-protein-cysteine methyltransferase-like protein